MRKLSPSSSLDTLSPQEPRSRGEKEAERHHRRRRRREEDRGARQLRQEPGAAQAGSPLAGAQVLEKKLQLVKSEMKPLANPTNNETLPHP